jgi:hypothetical protein
MGSNNVGVFVNTRQPAENAAPYDIQATEAIRQMQGMGIEVIYYVWAPPEVGYL